MDDYAASAAATDPAAQAALPRTARWLALGAIAGPVLFTLAWLGLGFVSPGYSIEGVWISPYSPIDQPISGLGMGDTGPYMNAAFVLSGLLLIVGLIGVFQTMSASVRAGRRRAYTAALALSPVGLVVAGIFTIEHDLPHFLGFGLAAASPVITFAAVGAGLRRVATWRRFGTYLIIGSPLTLLMLIVYMVSFDEATTAAGDGIAGLTSRILAIEVYAWFVAMGWIAFRRTSPRTVA